MGNIGGHGTQAHFVRKSLIIFFHFVQEKLIQRRKIIFSD